MNTGTHKKKHTLTHTSIHFFTNHWFIFFQQPKKNRNFSSSFFSTCISVSFSLIRVVGFQWLLSLFIKFSVFSFVVIPIIIIIIIIHFRYWLKHFKSLFCVIKKTNLARIWWFAIRFVVVTSKYCWQRCSHRQWWRFICTKSNSSWCSSQHFSIKYETVSSSLKWSWNITWVSCFFPLRLPQNPKRKIYFMQQISTGGFLYLSLSLSLSLCFFVSIEILSNFDKRKWMQSQAL